MTVMKPAKYWWLVASLSLACVGNEAPSGATDGSGSTATTGQQEAETAGDGVDSTATSEGLEPFVPVPARQIRIDRIDANQGVGFDLVREGELLEVTLPLLSRRPAMLRAMWEVDPQWSPRTIEGRLIMGLPDGSEWVRSSVLWIEGPRPDEALAPAFQWEVDAEHLSPGTEIAIELWEVEPGFEDLPEPDVPPRYPQTGAMELPIAPEHLEIELVLVPVHYQSPAEGGCASTVELDLPSLEQIFRFMEMQLPFNSLDVSIRPVGITVENTEEIINRLWQLRLNDAPGPQVIYMGIYEDQCDVAHAQGEGFVPSTPPRMDEANLRVGWTTYHPHSYIRTAYTLTHEVGHTLGRDHVTCSGNEANPDADYPFPDGNVGDAPGWGIYDGVWRDPRTHADFMTYCDPSWASRYAWDHSLPTIFRLSNWGAAEAPAAAADEVLAGFRRPGQAVHEWTRARIGVSKARVSVGESAEFVDPTGDVESVSVFVWPVADASQELVIIPMPRSGVSSLVHRDGSNERRYSLADERFGPRAR